MFRPTTWFSKIFYGFGGSNGQEFRLFKVVQQVTRNSGKPNMSINLHRQPAALAKMFITFETMEVMQAMMVIICYYVWKCF